MISDSPHYTFKLLREERAEVLKLFLRFFISTSFPLYFFIAFFIWRVLSVSETLKVSAVAYIFNISPEKEERESRDEKERKKTGENIFANM